MDDQNNVVADYLKAGVDLPELKETPEEPKEEPKEEAPVVPQPEEKKAEEEPLQEKQEERKPRSIYDEYKDKKSELKAEREAREAAERERDEYRAKLEAVNSARTPEEKRDAQDDLVAFAKEINADPEALRKMRDLFLKDAKPQTDEALQRDLEEFKSWKAQNSKMLETQHFEQEFTSIVPELKQMFPTADESELGAIKAELDKVSHTQEYHDKSLDYVAFKHRDTLKELVSPKKPGLERKGKTDATEESFDFDPNADFSKMTGKQREAWEKAYKNMTASDGLATDSDGRKIII